jgi:hypothetical protein
MLHHDAGTLAALALERTWLADSHLHQCAACRDTVLDLRMLVSATHRVLLRAGTDQLRGNVVAAPAAHEPYRLGRLTLTGRGVVRCITLVAGLAAAALVALLLDRPRTRLPTTTALHPRITSEVATPVATQARDQSPTPS